MAGAVRNGPCNGWLNGRLNGWLNVNEQNQLIQLSSIVAVSNDLYDEIRDYYDAQ
jgi:hypothetical protein